MMAMDASAREIELRHLQRLNAVCAALDGYQWMLEPGEGGQTHLVVVRANGEADCIATVFAGASPDERDLLCGSADALRFLLGLLSRARQRIRQLDPPPTPDPAPPRRDNSLALSAKALCEQVMFRRFLESKSYGGHLGDALAAETRLKFFLDFKSKAELNQPGRVRDAFLEFRSEYHQWKRG